MYYPELFRILGLLQSPLKAEDYPFEEFWQDFCKIEEHALVTAMLILPLIMAKREDLPDYHTDEGESDGFRGLAKGVLDAGESVTMVMARFVDIVQEMVDKNVI